MPANANDRESTETPFEYLHEIEECPDLEMLNYTTRYWHERLLETMLDSVWVEVLLEEMAFDLDPTSMDILVDHRDRLLCQELNERHWGLHLDVIYDFALDRTVPINYSTYYRQSTYIIELVTLYSAGLREPRYLPNGERAVGGPTAGWGVLKIYDRDLNLLGETGL